MKTSSKNMKSMKLNIAKVSNIKFKDLEEVNIDGVDSSDFPEFSDAFIESAKYKGKQLDCNTLDKLTDKFAKEVNQLAHEFLH